MPATTRRTFSLLDALVLIAATAIGLAGLRGWVGEGATLLLGRRWRAEPSRIDRAGRCLGVYWIGVIILPFCAMG
jgi:hypothetical protein